MPRHWYQLHTSTWLFAGALVFAFVVANNTERTSEVEWQRGVFQKTYGWPSFHTRTLYFEKPDDWQEVPNEYMNTSGARLFESKITKDPFILHKRTDEGEREDIFWLWDICVCAMMGLLAVAVLEILVRKWIHIRTDKVKIDIDATIKSSIVDKR